VAIKKAFTIIELMFIIVVIGILAIVAVPKFMVTRDDAILTKAKTTVANIRTALSIETQTRILKGVYRPVVNLGGGKTYNVELFDYFDGNRSDKRVLEYPVKSCKSATSASCWMRLGSSSYQYKLPSSIGGSVTFTVSGGRFVCDGTFKCKYLER